MIKQLTVKGRELNLFRHLWAMLEKEEETLREQYNIARNLAVSSWSNVMGINQPTQIHPEKADLLQKNYDMLLEELSMDRYLLLRAFKHVWKTRNGLTQKQLLCWDYWRKLLKGK